MSRGSIVVSDPWEVASILGGEPLTGTFVINTAESATFRLDQSIRVNGVEMKSGEVMIRHLGTSFVEHCRAVPANILFLSDEPTSSCSAIGTVSVD